MKRSTDQNAIMHAWFRQIADHMIEPMSPEMIKGVVKQKLGNTIELMGEKVPMPTSSYKRADEDLTEEDHKNGFISMNGLLIKIDAWAATDLMLQLEQPQ